MGWGTILLDISRNKKGTSVNIYCIFPKEQCSTYLKFKENPMFKIRYTDPAAQLFSFLLKTGIMYTSTDRLNLHMGWGTILVDISRNKKGTSVNIYCIFPKELCSTYLKFKENPMFKIRYTDPSAHLFFLITWYNVHFNCYNSILPGDGVLY